MLELKNLCKTFMPGTPSAHVALDNLSLTVNDGEFITLLGSNGAGKSTLFNAICGIFWLDDGRIVLDGKDITDLPEHRRAEVIGRIFQDPMNGTAPGMTIAENLALAYSRRKVHALSPGVRKRDMDMFRDRLARFEMGLEDRMQAKVGLLSGGQRQALTLLMATIGSPKLLLLDEHTAALDPSIAHKVMEITVRVVAEQKLTAMMITHNINDALTTGTRTLMLDQGRLLLDIQGEQRESMTMPQLLELYSSKTANALSDRTLFG